MLGEELIINRVTTGAHRLGIDRIDALPHGFVGEELGVISNREQQRVQAQSPVALIKNASETQKTRITNCVRRERPKCRRLVDFMFVTFKSLCERAV